MNDAQRDARLAAGTVGALLFAIYAATGAATLTFWDASEFATAIGTFGIPHPPGTPLYVAIGTALQRLLPVLRPVQIGTLVSVLATTGACAVVAWVTVRVRHDRTLGIVTGLTAGLMGTVWMNATETEVYAVALLSAALQLTCAWYAHRADSARGRILVAYIAALALPLHLSALVAAPAALLLANTAPDGRVRWRPLAGALCLVLATAVLASGHWIVAGAVVLASMLAATVWGRDIAWIRPAAVATLGAWSAVAILLLRARHDPFLNQGDPDILPRLLDVISRAQYDVAAPWPRRAPLWIQVGNLLQWADWQVALGLWNEVTPSWLRTPFTGAIAALGVFGAVAHWRAHRVTAQALVALFLLATVGVCVQLNLRAGPSFGVGVLPANALHEARERDYFFALGFWVWGLWLGIGAWALCRRRALPAALALAVPALMAVGSWSAVSRAAAPDKQMATLIADGMLRDAPARAMLFTAGDNDSYPLWYRQAVDAVRPDVQVVVSSLLPANWYFRESARRAPRLNADTTLAAAVVLRAGALASQQLDRRGVVAFSIAMPAGQRLAIGRIAQVACWRRVGLVDVGSRALLCPPRVDVERTFLSSQRLSSLLAAVPRQSPDGTVAAFQALARCPSLVASAAMRGVAVADSATRRLLDITCNLQ